MSEPLYPLGLDRLEWAARRELIMTMREAKGITVLAARMIGCADRKLELLLKQYCIDDWEFGGEPFPKSRPLNHKADEEMRRVIKEEILKVLKETNWNIKRSAKLLGIGRQTLYNRMEKLQISLGE